MPLLRKTILFRAVRNAALVAFFAASATIAHAQELDSTLSGSRWQGLSLKYPSVLLMPAHDQPAGDPNVSSVMNPDILRAKDNALEVWLSGSYNALNLADARHYMEQMLEWDKDGHPDTKVTYHASKLNWAVASGTMGDRSFYYKVIARCENGTAHCEQPETFAIAKFSYLASKHDAYDKVVAAMSQTLTAAEAAN